MSPEPETIIAEVAELTGIPVAAITGKRRTTRIIHARTLAMATARHAKQWWSLNEVAQEFHCDHCTIIHALRRHKRYMLCNSDYQQAWLELNRRLLTATPA